jgi:hypothetical protein
VAAFVVAKRESRAVEPNNAGVAALQHLHRAADAEAHLLEAMDLIRPAEQLINACSLTGGEHLNGKDFGHSGQVCLNGWESSS